MYNAKAHLLTLRQHGGNAIKLAMRPCSGKHTKQIGFNAANLITLSTAPSDGTAIQM